ncbi:DUF6153 family protein [Allosalinactinospora lopnorensis]|uniref:DUF6153 family protein n=1 Tax=Allosalinactinospora lopnorensis TaxID=1352348 RepID=UPI001F1C9AE1|nr:DUF6153 family protein [Allosalinactinospora lopnorensis]
MATATQRTPRHTALMWVLLLSLLIGVGAMHTLGHAPDSTHGAAAVTGPADPGPMHEEPGLPVLDPTSVCLAIGGFVIALLGVAAVALAHWPGALVRSPSWVRRWALRITSPPEPPSLAKLQVLRI